MSPEGVSEHNSSRRLLGPSVRQLKLATRGVRRALWSRRCHFMALIFCILGRLRPRSSSSPDCPQVMGPCFAGQTRSRAASRRSQSLLLPQAPSHQAAPSSCVCEDESELWVSPWIPTLSPLSSQLTSSRSMDHQQRLLLSFFPATFATGPGLLPHIAII